MTSNKGSKDKKIQVRTGKILKILIKQSINMLNICRKIQTEIKIHIPWYNYKTMQVFKNLNTKFSFSMNEKITFITVPVPLG
jgi:hypothetical protein